MSIYFEIQADDTKRAVNFYSKVFGWNFESVPGLPIEYFRITGKSINGGLLQRPAKTPPPECGTNAFVCSFEVPDYDKTEEVILSLGGITALPKFEVPGTCWQGYYLDNEKNVFGIIQVM